MGERTHARPVEPVVPAGEDDVAFRLVPERGDAFEASLAAPAPSESERAAAVSSGWDCALAFESTHAAMAAEQGARGECAPLRRHPHAARGQRRLRHVAALRGRRRRRGARSRRIPSRTCRARRLSTGWKGRRFGWLITCEARFSAGSEKRALGIGRERARREGEAASQSENEMRPGFPSVTAPMLCRRPSSRSRLEGLLEGARRLGRHGHQQPARRLRVAQHAQPVVVAPRRRCSPWET